MVVKESCQKDSIRGRSSFGIHPSDSMMNALLSMYLMDRAIKPIYEKNQKACQTLLCLYPVVLCLLMRSFHFKIHALRLWQKSQLLYHFSISTSSICPEHQLSFPANPSVRRYANLIGGASISLRRGTEKPARAPL